MAPVMNGRILFNAVPEGYPEPGKHTIYDETQIIDLDATPLNGGILIKALDISVDPYMRGRMRPPNIPSYMPEFDLGKPLRSTGIGVILRSEAAGYKPGDHVMGFIEHKHYSVIQDPSTSGMKIIQNPFGLKWTTFLGVLGTPGHTAYLAWKAYANAQKGQTVFVSTGAGAVGSLVIQLAKLDGCKVIGSAGSDEKVEFMKQLGADVAFNYKTANTLEVLRKEGPIDIYWDNVGGETLDAVLETAAFKARIIVCGMISTYNTSAGAVPVYNMNRVFEKCITIVGFLLGQLYADKEALEAFNKEIPPLVASGEIKHREHVFNGLEAVGEALLAVQKGTNNGKVIVHVADD